MKEEVAKKLVEAARSGKYKQTRGCLRSTKKVVEAGIDVSEERSCFCILGILCDLFANEHSFAYWKRSTFAGRPTPEMLFVLDVTDSDQKVEKCAFESVLPQTVVEWAGLKSQAGMFEVTNDMVDDLPGQLGMTEALMNLNDDYYWDLHRIADFVEKHWMHI
jgi:hypothetical protein